jgi:hypothetical protein
VKIIDRLPFADRPHLVTVRGEAVDVYRNLIDGDLRHVTLKTKGWP